MRNLLNLDNKFFRFLGKVADLVILNVLWLICCLPILTIGASTTALYYSVFKIQKNEESYIWRLFFQSFRLNLRQGTLFTIIFLLLGVFLTIDIYAYSNSGAIENVILVLIVILIMIWLMTLSYVFPFLSWFQNSAKETLKNAFYMSIGNLPYTVLIVILNMIPGVVMIFFTDFFIMSAPLWFFIGESAIAYFNAKLFIKIFDKYL